MAFLFILVISPINRFNRELNQAFSTGTHEQAVEDLQLETTPRVIAGVGVVHQEVGQPVIYLAEQTLDNTAIKALLTPITLVAALGANLSIVPVAGIITRGGDELAAYGGYDEEADFLGVTVDPSFQAVVAFAPIIDPKMGLFNILGTRNGQAYISFPALQSYPETHPEVFLTTDFLLQDKTAAANTPLTAYLSLVSGVNLTGGDSSNTLTFSILFAIRDLA